MRSKITWLLVLVLAALLVAACGPTMATAVPSEATLAPTAEEATLHTVGSESQGADDWHVQGASSAPVTIVEYSDFQCPYCARYSTETYPEIKAQYIDTGKVRYMFRHFPLSFHSEAELAAQAAECAGEQGKFWEMHDTLFANQSEWAGSADAEAALVGRV
jgi:protein-disulfide isomerase